MSLRVLHLDAGRQWRGGQNQVRLLCRAQTRDTDLTTRLLTRRDGELAVRAAREGVEVLGVSWGPAFDVRAGWAAALEIRRFEPDILHAHDAHALAIARAARALARSRAALLAHRRVDFRVRPGGAWFHADRIVAISEAVRAVLIGCGIEASRIAVVPSGVDADEVRATSPAVPSWRGRLGLPPGAPLAVNVAALAPHKDHLTLVRAAARARAARPDLRWAVAGEGETRSVVEAEIARLGLGDRMTLLGQLDSALPLVREADVFVMSSREEGLGSAILEALALGRPVAATRGGGIPEILPETALAPVGDADALARAAIEALAHPAPPLPERFTAAATARGVRAIYESMTRTAGAPRA